jgi:hypothetical protein
MALRPCPMRPLVFMPDNNQTLLHNTCSLLSVLDIEQAVASASHSDLFSGWGGRVVCLGSALGTNSPDYCLVFLSSSTLSLHNNTLNLGQAT